ncbi:MAG TPA: hypothetical protein VGL88_05975 [Pseudonocardiaceae bacterium]|jgi:hypothetical protein
MERATTGVATSRKVIAWIVQLIGAVGCLAVTVIHVMDQGGLPGSKTPEYVQIGYYVLEIAGILAAMLLLLNWAKTGWFLSLGVAAGPIIGYVLSRGPGLPDYTDDIGNWTEPLGVISLVLEGVLFIMGMSCLLAIRRSNR